MSTDGHARGSAPSAPDDELLRNRRWLAAAAFLALAVNSLGSVLSPYLLVDHPLVLLGLNPQGRHLVLVANHVDFWQAATVAGVRRGIQFMAIFALATLYGRQLLQKVEGKRPWAKRLVGLVERAYGRFGLWLVAFVPVAGIAGLAGLAGTSWWRVAVAMLPGQIAIAAAWLWVGESLSTWTEPLVAYLSEAALEATLLSIIAMLAYQLWSRIRTETDSEAQKLTFTDTTSPRPANLGESSTFQRPSSSGSGSYGEETKTISSVARSKTMIEA